MRSGKKRHCRQKGDTLEILHGEALLHVPYAREIHTLVSQSYSLPLLGQLVVHWVLYKAVPSDSCNGPARTEVAVAPVCQWTHRDLLKPVSLCRGLKGGREGAEQDKKGRMGRGRQNWMVMEQGRAGPGGGGIEGGDTRHITSLFPGLICLHGTTRTCSCN